MFFNIFLILIAIISVLVYVDFKIQVKFWKKKNVPFLEPMFPMGNITDILRPKTHFGYLIKTIYDRMKHAGDFCGIYFSRNPVLLVLTPEFAKIVLVRDFNNFMDRGVYSNEKIDPLGANMFFLEGHRWKNLRAKLTPTFTSGKLKLIFHTVLDVGEKLVKYLAPFAESSHDIEVYDLFARYTTDVISSSAFGFDANSLEDPDTEFVRMGKKVLHFNKMKSLKIFFAMGFREQAKKLGIRFNDEDVEEFFIKIVGDTIDQRRRTGFHRNDFMQILMDLMGKDGTEGKESDESLKNNLTFNEIAAQAFAFYFAGFDSSSTTLAFCLHSLAFDTKIQQKARESVQSALDKHNGEWSYEALVDMTYIDQVIEETLRLFPPVTTIHRIVTKDYKLPNGEILPKGNLVIIPNFAFQRDPEIFPDPIKFDPERFSSERKATRSSFASLPFGEGPRYCLGMRFGLLQIKLAIAILLHNYEFLPCDKTDFPIKIDTSTIIHAPLKNVWLKIKKI